MKLTKKSILLAIAIFLPLAITATIITLVIASSNSTTDPEPAISKAPETGPSEETPKEAEETQDEPEEPDEPETPAAQPATPVVAPASPYSGGNCTSGLGKLMLINPVFTVGTDFIAARSTELIDLTTTYGIIEGNQWNGRPLLDAEAGAHLNEMINAYKATYPGHTIETRSCFRARGTSCGRLCYATGTSDHHTGYTCDLLDPAYGTDLDYSLDRHIEWQWLKANSYKYGFIDRFPAEWAGGSMNEPINITEEGSTGLYELWHYRYVGIEAATEIATGKYNNGGYDSLEHYLKARGFIASPTAGTCR